MSSGSTFVWVGLALLGVAMCAPTLPKGGAEAPVVREGKRPTSGQAGSSWAGAAAPGGFASRAIERSADGHFYADAMVNGAQIRFLVDTGASMVALTPADAQRAGIALTSERARAVGAGGELEVIPISIERIAIGPLEARDVRGAVAETLDVSLLGQSFLAQVGTVEIRGDTMMLR